MNDFNKQLKKLFSHASRVRMTQEDKLAVRNALLSRTGIVPIKTPYFIHIVSMMSQSRYAATVVACIFVLSGSVGYASNQALPGDALYTVKTDMTEKVEGFLVLGEKSKAKHEVKLAERRLEEATTLARAGKLEESIQVELQKNIEEHVAKASEHITELSKKDDLSDAIEVTGALEDTLEVHSESLAKISESVSDTQSSTAVATLLASVAEQTQMAQEATSRVEVEVAAKADETAPVDDEQDFVDTETLDVLDEDFFEGDMTYKDELFITDGEVVSDDIDVTNELQVESVLPVSIQGAPSQASTSPQLPSDLNIHSLITPFKF